MSSLEFIASLVRSLAWPAFLLLAVVVLRAPLDYAIRRLADRFEAFAGFGFKAKWSKGSDEVGRLLTSSEAAAATGTVSEREVVVPGAPALESERALGGRAVVREPLDEAWLLVGTLPLAAIVRGFDIIDRTSEAARFRTDAQAIVEQIVAGLRNLRDIAVDHGPVTTPAMAVEYLERVRSGLELIDRVKVPTV